MIDASMDIRPRRDNDGYNLCCCCKKQFGGDAASMCEDCAHEMIEEHLPDLIHAALQLMETNAALKMIRNGVPFRFSGGNGDGLIADNEKILAALDVRHPSQTVEPEPQLPTLPKFGGEIVRQYQGKEGEQQKIYSLYLRVPRRELMNSLGYKNAYASHVAALVLAQLEKVELEADWAEQRRKMFDAEPPKGKC